MKPFVGLLALLGASTASAQVGLMPGGGYSNVQFSLLAKGTDGATNASGVFSFDEPVSFENYWRANHRGPAPYLQPGFFQSWRLVAIHAGPRPGTGYGLGVTNITRQINRATITAIETVPPARNGRSGGRRGPSAPTTTTSPWILLRVERGAFDFVLQTRQVQGYAESGPGRSGGPTTVKMGGVTVTFPPR